MIEVGSGNLLSADVEALVNTVNTVGVMGKGLALQFRRRFPANFDVYAAACARRDIKIGRMLVVETRVFAASDPDLFAKSLTTAPPARLRYIINFPTKQHWRDPSRLEYLRVGLIALIEEIRARSIRSIAIPPLGCGNGRLAWSDVEPLIKSAFSALVDVRVVLFGPNHLELP